MATEGASVYPLAGLLGLILLLFRQVLSLLQSSSLSSPRRSSHRCLFSSSTGSAGVGSSDLLSCSPGSLGRPPPCSPSRACSRKPALAEVPPPQGPQGVPLQQAPSRAHQVPTRGWAAFCSNHAACFELISPTVKVLIWPTWNSRARLSSKTRQVVGRHLQRWMLKTLPQEAPPPLSNRHCRTPSETATIVAKSHCPLLVVSSTGWTLNSPLDPEGFLQGQRTSFPNRSPGVGLRRLPHQGFPLHLPRAPAC